MLKKIVIGACTLIVLLIVINAVLSKVYVPEKKYKNAISLAEQGDYAEALRIFTSLGEY